MAELDSVVSVSITADTTALTRAGFGTPAFVSYHTRFTDRFRIYTGIGEMEADGFDATDAAHKWAKVVFSQSPTVEKVVVGRLPAAPSYSMSVVITDATVGNHIKLSVLSPTTGLATDIDYTIPAAATTTTVATAVEALIEAVAGVDSVASAATITVTPTTAGKKVFLYGNVGCTVQETTADAGYDDELSLLLLEPGVDFYFVNIDSESTANINAVAAWALANKKMFFTASQSSGLPAGTDTLGSALLALGNDRTVIIYSPTAHEYAGGAWCAVIGSRTPGALTAAFKELKGVTPASLTTTQKTALEVDNINHYQAIRNRKVTRPGVVAAGEWIDIMHGIDALTARVQENAFDAVSQPDKVPFTETGFDIIRAAILAACAAFTGTPQQPGLLVSGSVVVVFPALADISVADKAARRLTGVKFAADLAGAIHYVSIRGVLSNA